MRKLFIIALLAASLTACKKEKSTEPAAEIKPGARVVSIEDLAAQSIGSKEDWSRDISIYIDDVLTCANGAPGQTKYVFRADAFETPPVSLILLKTEDDRIFACSMEAGDPAPHYKEISLKPDEKSARFYPADLPKADSCLNNTRVLDKTGHTAGWLSKITC